MTQGPSFAAQVLLSGNSNTILGKNRTRRLFCICIINWQIWLPKQVYKKIYETEARKINHSWNKILKVSCSWTPQERNHFSFLLYSEHCRGLRAMECFLCDGFCWSFSTSSAAEEFLFTRCARQFSCGCWLSSCLNCF